jgi:prevent-host-death family protein
MPWMEVNVHEAKTNFSKLLQRVALGEEITIAKAGVPVARLVPVETAKRQRQLGLYRGQIWMADDFDAPLPPEIQAAFEGEEPPVPGSRKRNSHRKRKKA